MMLMRYGMGVTLLLMLWAVPVLAVEIHVRPDGDDQFTGASKRPFKTINRALQEALPGDTVLVWPGTYHETVKIDVSGTAEKPVTIRAVEDGAVIDGTGLKWAMLLTGASHVVIEGLEVTGSDHTCLLLNHFHEDPAKGTSHITLRNLHLHHCGLKGYSALLVGGHDNLVEHNRITHSGYDVKGSRGRDDHGLYLMGDRNVIRRNVITDNAHSGIRMEGNGNHITENQVMRNGRHGLTIWVDAPYTARNTVIAGNHFADQQDSVIRLHGEGDGETPDGVVITKNTIVQTRPVEAAIEASGGVKGIMLEANRISGEYFDNRIVGVPGY